MNTRQFSDGDIVELKESTDKGLQHLVGSQFMAQVIDRYHIKLCNIPPNGTPIEYYRHWLSTAKGPVVNKDHCNIVNLAPDTAKLEQERRENAYQVYQMLIETNGQDVSRVSK